MTDVTPQKRVLPARERRESATKRLATSSAIPSPPVNNTPPTTEAIPRQKRKYTKRASLVKVVDRTPDSSTPGPGEDILPTKFISTKPLPVLREKQPENLSDIDYQSFADSALLAASLHRSRMQWLCEGIFKKYWVKPMKRKGVVIEPPNNPDVKTMQKLGNATITIEPHTFDATFYTVKDPNSHSVPYQRHPNQHTPKPHQPAITHSPSQIPAARPGTQSNATTPQPSTPTTTVKVPVKQEHGSQVKQPAPPPPAQQPARPPNAPTKPSDDPVIQMLAARAAGDSRLKDLMKVVAMSQATPEQLREFQSHIDEFNAVVKQREAKRLEAEQKNKASPVPTTSQTASSKSAVPPNRPPIGGPGPAPMQPPPYMAYHAPPYRPEPIIKHVIVEFHSPVSFSQGSTTDRWLFPEHAVLEMKPNGMEMIASFFVERSGDDILKMDGNVEDNPLRQKFQPDVEYFQPVTMTIRATQHRTIETIARAATTLPEVVRHIKEVMEKKTRAPQEYLVHRLPRDKPLTDHTASDFIDSGLDVSEAEDDELKSYYGI